jgi:hypothetical protein
MGPDGLSGFAASDRERWICRSDEPVKMYVPPSEEKVMALIGPLCEVSVFTSDEGTFGIGIASE